MIFINPAIVPSHRPLSLRKRLPLLYVRRFGHLRVSSLAGPPAEPPDLEVALVVAVQLARSHPTTIHFVVRQERKFDVVDMGERPRAPIVHIRVMSNLIVSLQVRDAS